MPLLPAGRGIFRFALHRFQLPGPCILTCIRTCCTTMAYLDTESDLDQPWHAVGLGTPAGNALFRLYGGRRAQNAGNQFSAHNMARLATMPPAAPKMEALPQTRKKVSVPRPTGRRDTGEIDDIPRMRRYNFTGKKSVATIEMEQASRAVVAARGRPTTVRTSRCEDARHRQGTCSCRTAHASWTVDDI